MACIFLSFSFTYIFNRKLLYFTIIITIGSFFHSSLLFMFPFYFLYGISNKSLFFIIISIFLLSYLIGPLLKTLESIIQIIQPGKDLMSRLDDKLDTNKILGYGRKIYTILGFYFFYSINKTNKTDKKITFFLHVSYFSFILYYLGVNYISILASRLDIYIAIISTSILAGLIGNSLPTKKHKIIFFFFITSLVIIYYLRLEFMDLFHPYSSIFYNYNYNRKLY